MHWELCVPHWSGQCHLELSELLTRVTMVWEWVSTASISLPPRRRDGWSRLAFTGGTLDATLKFSMHLGTLGKGDLSNQEWKG